MCGRYIVVVFGLVLPIVSGLLTNCQDKEGGGCSVFCQCTSGLQCEAGSHICRGPAKEGEACHLTRHCGPGLICKEWHHVCERMGGVGEKCLPRFMTGFGRACNYQANNWCDPLSRKCLPPSGRGNVCGFMGAKEDTGECAAGLSCSCDTACSIRNMLRSLQGAISGTAQTIQDLVGSHTFCCKCV